MLFESIITQTLPTTLSNKTNWSLCHTTRNVPGNVALHFILDGTSTTVCQVSGMECVLSVISTTSLRLLPPTMSNLWSYNHRHYSGGKSVGGFANCLPIKRHHFFMSSKYHAISSTSVESATTFINVRLACSKKQPFIWAVFN